MSSKRERDERRILRDKKFSAENVYGNHEEDIRQLVKERDRVK